MTEVGVVGLGVMGSAIARRLFATGHAVRVHDIRPEAVDELVGEGATAAGTAAEVAAAGLVILSLNSPQIVENAVFGPRGLLTGRPHGVVVIDMSSIDPGRTREYAARARQLGARWVDAPLSGGAPGALNGTLTLMVGGDAHEVEAATPVLRALAATVTHLGPSGSGQLVKLVNQVLVGCTFAALAESAALVRAAGLQPEDVLGALIGGRADSAVLREFFTKFAELDLTPTGRLRNMVKDLESARDYARSADIPLPITSAVSELHRWAVAAGHGDADNAALMHYYRETA
ncbi:2-hydroxy-3-oxopropionate reductase [Lentzea atacamensis]|uniref:2-hydroxy-3-oxopropionate reductase n=1 Tax=Lentzea atacamensis TaxID=531938 RepID=A0A316HYS4_9PSEU|nr:NAD(P)-dependent oxidoreductase [Lentzea atacamensis]PWK85535.1 2-hydroxy-3-oxopropionate reductase [Lentzea atacamensis]